MVANQGAKAECPFGTYDIFASSPGALLTKTIVVKQRLLTFQVIPCLYIEKCKTANWSLRQGDEVNKRIVIKIYIYIFKQIAQYFGLKTNQVCNREIRWISIYGDRWIGGSALIGGSVDRGISTSKDRRIDGSNGSLGRWISGSVDQ